MILPYNHSVDIFCIGNPNIRGDSIGPLIGTILSKHEFVDDVKVIGTLDDPVTVSTFEDMLCRLRPESFVIAIDASMGGMVSTYQIVYEPIRPGSGMAVVPTNSIPVGHASIKCFTCTDYLDALHCRVDMIHSLALSVTTMLTDLLKVTNKVYI